MSKTFAKLSTPSDLSNEGHKELEVLKGRKVGVNLAVFLLPFYFLRLENYPSEQNYIEVLSLPSEVYCRKKKTFHRVPLQFILVI